MPARTPVAAVHALRDRSRRALLCIADPHVLISPGGYQPTTAPHALTLAHDPVLLDSDDPIVLSIRLYYRIVPVGGRGGWQVETAAYYYTLFDVEGREIVGYHWHPETPGVAYPHLHIERGAVRLDVLERAGLPRTRNALRLDLAGAHLPTHQMSLEEMLWMVIAQFDVRPRRADWEAVLRS